jgi:Protein of unknown function (DUF3300)
MRHNYDMSARGVPFPTRKGKKVIKHVFARGIARMLVVMLCASWPARLEAQGAAAFKPEEIEQLVAPIALYPDSLVSQILMGSTYPLEIVEADRWTRQNKNLKGDSFAAALEKQSWDPSVKSLVNFPQVLSMMSEKLEITQKLGDVFLAQQKDVLDAIQRLRAKAQAAGNLKTTNEQKVIVEQAPAASQTTTIIKIEPAQPQVVYVPTYNPTVVYGAWPYPAYPPTPWYQPGYVATAAFSFAAGVAVGAAWGYAWGGCNWGRGDVDIDVNRNVNINNTHINRQNYERNFQARGQANRASFQHDPGHRKGVGYRDNGTAQKFNRGTNAQAAQSREAFRGRADSGRQELARSGGGLGDRGKADGGQLSKAADRGGGLSDRGGSGSVSKAGGRGRGSLDDHASSRGGGGGDRSRGQGGGLSERGGGGRDGGSRRESGAFQGMGQGGEVRNASARGSASRASSGGGGHRAGGGGGRGGGGRRH